MANIWIDYSFARPDLHVAKQTGAKGALRYLSQDNPNTHGKILQAGERDAIFAAGLDLILNYEWYEGRCNEGGAAGRADGAVAMAQARALGYPKGACIYFSHDTGVNNFSAIHDYFDGVAAALAGYYDVGAYSGYSVVHDLLGAGKAKYGWQTRAWSNGVRDPHAVIYQNGNYWFGQSADEDEVIGYVDSWKQNLAPAPVVTPTPTPVPPPAPRPAPVPAPVGNRVYVVKSGDTLSGIAARFQIAGGWQRLAQLNHLADPNHISVGQSIHLDQQAPAPAVRPTGQTYVVQQNDNLTVIARRYPQAWITAQSIARLNGIALPPGTIYPGQLLRIG